MKNQYFGDSRDFFKFDLVLTAIEEIDSLKSFTYIPMLTEDDCTTDGNVTQYNGSRRMDLDSLLKNCIMTSNRNIHNLSAFINCQNNNGYHPYRETEYFYHASRMDYFNGIETQVLDNAVILFDPDIGLEVKNMKKRNMYLRYSELKQVFERTTNSLVIIYQHIPREQRLQYFSRTSETIKNHLGVEKCICVSDNEIVFFVLCKNSDLLSLAWEVIEDYGKRNKFLAYLL